MMKVRNQPKLRRVRLLAHTTFLVMEKMRAMVPHPNKVISGVFPETWGYFCMKNFISTTRNCHSHIHESTHYILFALLKVYPHFSLVWLVGPLNSWVPEHHPG
jgi:hypothetical protein